MWRMDVLVWLAVAAYALHIMEERILNWPESVRKAINVPFEHDNYRIITRVFFILGVIAAILLGTAPMFALGFGVFLLINAVVFHLWPMISTQKFSPGSWTAIFLFLPIVYMEYVAANLQPAAWLWPVVIGVAITAFPLLLLKYGAKGRRR